MTFGGGNLRGQIFQWRDKTVTAENSGHSNNQVIFNLLNTPILLKMTRPTVFRLRTPPPNVISQAGLTLNTLPVDFLGRMQWWWLFGFGKDYTTSFA
jgi:hypothetical protein